MIGAIDNQIIGAIAVADTVKGEAELVIQKLKQMKIQV
jgi:cation transport ATPase